MGKLTASPQWIPYLRRIARGYGAGSVRLQQRNRGLLAWMLGSWLLVPICACAAPDGNAASAPKAPSPAAENTTKDAATPEILPSRYISDNEFEAYVASLSSVFSMRARPVDPFGNPQDPNAKPVVKASAPKAQRRAATIQATPFTDIIRLIKVTTIMPKEQRFLIGNRALRVGDQIPLNYRGKSLQVQVISVRAKQIEFRNMETGETASLSLSLMPPGMTRGNNGIKAPGMVSERNSAIELDSASGSSSLPLNR